MYQVGFGDCFLLSFEYGAQPDPAQDRHMLIDFGSTRRPVSSTVTDRDVVALIEEHCGGRLTAFALTHRHKDHLSAFGDRDTDATLRRLAPRVIIRPWTENPHLPPDATGAHPAGVPAARAALENAEKVAKGIADTHAGRGGVAGDLADDADYQGPNENAVSLLDELAAAQDARYLRAGDDPDLGRLLPGVTVTVLGPPDADQHAEVATQTASDPEYWMLRLRGLTAALALSGPDGPPEAVQTPPRPPLAVPESDGETQPELVEVAPGYRDSAGRRLTAGPATGAQPEIVTVPVAAPRDLPPPARACPPGPVRWLVQHADAQQTRSAMRLVRALDDAMNNTSLVLLVTVGNLRRLFPGDAQIENWRYTLAQLEKSSRLRSELAAVDLYKVGHHGSRNASPPSLVEMWDGRDDLTMLMSTRPGVHGKSEATAVPRRTLVEALERLGTLHSTADLPNDQAYIEVVAESSGGPFAIVAPG